MKRYKYAIGLFALAVGTVFVFRWSRDPQIPAASPAVPADGAAESLAPLGGRPAPSAGRLPNTDRLDPSKVLEQRLTDLGGGWFERLTLVDGGGSYPFHRIEEKLKYDETADAFTVVSQFMAAADQLLVKLRPGSDAAALEELNDRFGTSTLKAMGFANRYMVQLPELSLDALDEYTALFEAETQVVERVDLNGIRSVNAVPNDSYYSYYQWDKRMVGCETAWETETGSSNIVVAVIDTGVDLDHEDLAARIWHNAGEAGALATNGIDDDANGYIDDWVGWDFGQDDNDPDDNGDGYDSLNDGNGAYGHGTHCAGIIGAAGNNGTGIAGMCWNIRIMALKPFEYFPAYTNMFVYDSKAVAAMIYAADNGAKVTSNSYGGSGDVGFFYEDGIYYLQTNGVLFVAAAGNDGTDNDAVAHWPSNVDLDNVIAVGSSDEADGMSYFSNYGETTVDLFAPGSSIVSTYPGDAYWYMSGTSMACPQAAGAAALLLSCDPDLSWSDCRAALLDTVDTSAAFTNRCVSAGRMNAAAALELTALEDADGDGLPDDWEKYYYGSSSVVDAGDTASNGVNTVWETYVAGISPTDSSARFEIENIENDAVLGRHVLEWTEADERLYTVYWTPNLQITAFTAIVSNYSGGAFTDLIHASQSVGFYRLGVGLDSEE